MSSSLVIRIVGGVCGGAIGTYISGKIYDYFNSRPQINSPETNHQIPYYENKIKDAKSFEEILQIQVKEQIENCNKYDYEYDNEYGNTVEIKEKEIMFVNDAIYDNNYIDYYSLLFE
jgi:hypothetical protein